MSSYLGFPLAQTGADAQQRQSLAAGVPAPVQPGTAGQRRDRQSPRGVRAVLPRRDGPVENHIGFDVLTNTDPFRVQFDGSLFIETWAALRQCHLRPQRLFSLKAGARYSWEKRHLRNNTGLGSAALNQLVLDPLQWDDSKTWDDFSPSLGVEVPAQRRLAARRKLVARLQERHCRDRLDPPAIGHSAAAVRRSREGRGVRGRPKYATRRHLSSTSPVSSSGSRTGNSR